MSNVSKDVRVYGYARVSTKEQSLSRQLVALTDYGVPADRIVTDKLSGKDFNREGYCHLKDTLLRAGDTLVIKELDRLGRDWDMIKAEWQALESAGVNMIVIDQPMLNTVGKNDLEKRLISGIMFDLLAYMAEKERQKIKSRQAEGIASMEVNTSGKKVSAKTGNEYGRPTAQRPENWEKVYTAWKAGKLTAVRAMLSLDLKKTTFYKLVKEYEAEMGVTA